MRWHLAGADGALIVIVFRRQKVAEAHLKLAECARELRRFTASRVWDDFCLFVGASPADRAAIVSLPVDRNAPVEHSLVVMQLHVAVDLLAMLVLGERFVFVAFTADAVEAASRRVDALTFVITFAADLALG